MIDRRVPGYARDDAMAVTSGEVAAAKLLVERAGAAGEPVDPAIEAIANAEPWPVSADESEEARASA